MFTPHIRQMRLTPIPPRRLCLHLAGCCYNQCTAETLQYTICTPLTRTYHPCSTHIPSRLVFSQLCTVVHHGALAKSKLPIRAPDCYSLFAMADCLTLCAAFTDSFSESKSALNRRFIGLDRGESHNCSSRSVTSSLSILSRSAHRIINGF